MVTSSEDSPEVQRSNKDDIRQPLEFIELISGYQSITDSLISLGVPELTEVLETN